MLRPACQTVTGVTRATLTSPSHDRVFQWSKDLVNRREPTTKSGSVS